MKLQSQSNIVRWAYLLRARPFRTSLCSLFWNAVLVTPATCLALVLISPILLPVLGVRYVWVAKCKTPFKAWQRQREAAEYKRWLERYNQKLQNPKSDQPSAFVVLFHGVKAIKNKVCPIVEFE